MTESRLASASPPRASACARQALTVLQTNPIFAAFMPFGSDGVWSQHVGWIDATNLAGGSAAILCMVGLRHLACYSPIGQAPCILLAHRPGTLHATREPSRP